MNSTESTPFFIYIFKDGCVIMVSSLEQVLYISKMSSE